MRASGGNWSLLAGKAVVFLPSPGNPVKNRELVRPRMQSSTRAARNCAFGPGFCFPRIKPLCPSHEAATQSSPSRRREVLQRDQAIVRFLGEPHFGNSFTACLVACLRLILYIHFHLRDARLRPRVIFRRLPNVLPYFNHRELVHGQTPPV